MSILKQALDIHDGNPVLAGKLLKEIVFEGLNEGEKNTFSWLVNHVFGDALSDWSSAFTLLDSSKYTGSHLFLINLSVAAYCSGNPLRALAAELVCVELIDSDLMEVKLLIAMQCLAHMRRAIVFSDFLFIFSSYSREINCEVAPVVGKSLAAVLNNLVSNFIDDAELEIDNAFHRQVAVEAAVKCKELWLHFGTWINHERSLYLCALTFIKFEEWSLAIESVNEALIIIESNGAENVDKAFLLLESAKAYKELGEHVKARAHLDEADYLAEQFDQSLVSWFLDMRSRLNM